jgi:exosome complex exonuclease DIS3/RRP44
VIVHRLLAASIDLEPLPEMISNRGKLSRVAQQMNRRHRMARLASRASSDYHTYLFFKERQATDLAILTAVKKDTVVLLLPTYGFEAEHSLTGVEKVLGVGRRVLLGNGKEYSLFDRVPVQVNVKLESFKKKV